MSPETEWSEPLALDPLPLRRATTSPGIGLFPPYAYVPGHGPHPVVHPAGHSHGAPIRTIPAVTEENWVGHKEYQDGIALFNAGYFWEAHETWEGAWRATPEPRVRSLLQALIQLAAAIVKMREGRFGGVPAFAGRIREKLASMAAGLPRGQRIVGVDPGEIEVALRAVEAAALGEDVESLVGELEPLAPR